MNWFILQFRRCPVWPGHDASRQLKNPSNDAQVRSEPSWNYTSKPPAENKAKAIHLRFFARAKINGEARSRCTLNLKRYTTNIRQCDMCPCMLLRSGTPSFLQNPNLKLPLKALRPPASAVSRRSVILRWSLGSLAKARPRKSSPPRRNSIFPRVHTGDT